MNSQYQWVNTGGSYSQCSWDSIEYLQESVMFKRRSSKASVSLYVSLGLTRHASQDDIQRAYHTLHLKYKQDALDKKKGARKKVKEVEKAYGILGNPSKRAMYDEHGTTGRWVKIRQYFTPESLDKQHAIVKGLFTCCFAATCCCFCYCCNMCASDTCDDYDQDEVYIRTTFPEYLTQSASPSPAGTPFGARRRRAEIKEVAMKRRHDRIQKRKEGKMGTKDSGYNDERCKDRNENIDDRRGDEQPLKITKRSLIKADSGYNNEGCKNGHGDDIDPQGVKESSKTIKRSLISKGIRSSNEEQDIPEEIIDPQGHDRPSMIMKRYLIKQDSGYQDDESIDPQGVEQPSRINAKRSFIKDNGHREEEQKDRDHKENEDNKDQIGKDQPSEIAKRALIGHDSGCDIGLDNFGFTNDVEVDSSNCHSVDHSRTSDQSSVESYEGTMTPNNSDSSNDGIDKRIK